MIKILLADDQKLLRDSFKKIIELYEDMQVIATAKDGQEAIELCKTLIPDIILMDISMPVIDGIEATQIIKKTLPHVKILVLTAAEDREIVNKAIQSGADGFIIKNIGTEELILSIRSVVSGLGIIHGDLLGAISDSRQKTSKNQNETSVYIEDAKVSLSERDLSIIQMVVDGMSNQEIALALFMAEGTIKNKITELLSKLNLKDKTQLAVYALKNNLPSNQ